jgi:hypothetical protein
LAFKKKQQEEQKAMKEATEKIKAGGKVGGKKKS